MSTLENEQTRLETAIADTVRRRAEGESLADEAVLAEHPDIARPLAEALRRLRVIAQARQIADRSGPSTAEPLWPVGVADETGCKRRIGHFELLWLVGEGGFGEVWEAEDTRLNRRVAVKLPRRGLSAKQVESFAREARAAAHLRHPNIVTVYEVGQVDELPYIVSELIHGRPLSKWLADRQPDFDEIARLCVTIADALAHAHEEGIVHRDLKPANVLIDDNDEPHLLDFGLAKRESAERTLTTDGNVMGTLAYMSPEQACGTAHTCTPASDVYSLGVMLYEMLTSELPFGGSPTLLVQRLLADEPPSPRKHRPDVPRDLETISLKCLEKEPARRYASAAQLADDLARAVRGEPIAARPLGALGRGWRWYRRNRIVANLAAAVLVTSIAGTAAATYYALAARSSLAAAVAATRRAEQHHHAAQRAAYNAQLARAAGLAFHSPREALELLNDADVCLPRLRDFVWHYLADQARREGQVLAGHTDRVVDVAFSPDGGLLATASRDGTLRLWNTADWSPRAVLKGHRGAVTALAFVPGSDTLVSAGEDFTVRRWDAQTGRQLEVVAREASAVQCVAASPDGRLVAWSTSGVLFWGDGILPRITLYDVAAGAVRHRLKGATDTVGALLFAPDGNRLYSGGFKGDPRIRVWDCATGASLGVMEGHESSISGLAFLADGRTLVSAGERLRFWDAVEGAPKAGFAHNPAQGVNCLAISADGREIAVGQWSRDVVVLDAATGSMQTALAGHAQEGIFALAYSSDGKYLASVGADHEVRVWDVVRFAHTARELTCQSERIVSVAVAPDGSLVAAAAADGQAHLWEPRSGRRLRSWVADRWELRGIALDAEHRRAITVGREGMVRVWSLDDDQPARAWRATRGPARGLALSTDGMRVVTAGADGSVALWELAGGTQLRAFGRLASEAASVAVGPRDLVAAGGADGTIRLWRADGTILAKIDAHHAEVTSLAFYPDGATLVSCSADATAKQWNVPAGTCRVTLRPRLSKLGAACVSGDGQTLGVAGYKLSLRDAASGQERCTLEDGDFSWCAAFSADGRWLVSGHDRGVVRIRRGPD